MHNFGWVYNNYISSMSTGVDKVEDHNYSYYQKSKLATNCDDNEIGLPFNVEMTVSQANAIARLLPPNYSIHVDRAIKTKRIPKRTFTIDRKTSKILREGDDEASMNELIEDQPYEEHQALYYDEVLKHCQKILAQLKKNKSSWPFRKPVDPIGMGIPHYLEIITNPMDLSTVEENLNANKYSTIGQFYADIQLIISNSYTFNKNNIQYNTLTSDFQKCFEKLKSEPTSMGPTSTSSLKKQNTKSVKPQRDHKNAIEISERKELVIKLKHLPREELSQLISKVNDPGEKSTQLNMETLPADKIRFLQNYLAKRDAHHTHHAQPSSRAKQLVKKPTKEIESSFQSDSDS